MLNVTKQVFLLFKTSGYQANKITLKIGCYSTQGGKEGED